MVGTTVRGPTSRIDIFRKEDRTHINQGRAATFCVYRVADLHHRRQTTSFILALVGAASALVARAPLDLDTGNSLIKYQPWCPVCDTVAINTNCLAQHASCQGSVFKYVMKSKEQTFRLLIRGKSNSGGWLHSARARPPQSFMSSGSEGYT